MTIHEVDTMRKRTAFKRVMIANRIGITSLEHLEASFDALKATDQAKLPMFQRDVKYIDDLLKAWYSEGSVN